MPRKIKRKNDRPIGVLDFETDPFKHGRVPYPFAACVFFDRADYVTLWGKDVLERLIRYLRQIKTEVVLYAHNGGKFDFHFLIEYADPQEIKIQNGRVMSMKIGKVELKDSYPLMPFALEDYKKTKIDYRKFEENRREKYRDEICAYMLDDCVHLKDLITGFRSIVGAKDTIGSAAFFNMKLLGLEIERLTENHDELFRPYFFGGRVEAFKPGIHHGRYVYVDVNSAYPFAMLHGHAHGSDYMLSDSLPRVSDLGPQFLRITATSRGALPVREDDGGISFPHATRDYYATGWEVSAGLGTRTLQVHAVKECWTPCNLISFRDYVETFFAKRLHAKKTGDKIAALAYKYLLNSGYGKFAQNPRDFKTYRLAPFGEAVEAYDWETDYGGISLWSKPSYTGRGFYDVATSASITGFQRAALWRGICASDNVLYCDTDALVAKETSVPQGEALGQWKVEGIIKEIRIAGKKLYGLRWTEPQDGEEFKIASKGARLSWADLGALCRGKTVEWNSEAPAFNATRPPRFVSRRIRATGGTVLVAG